MVRLTSRLLASAQVKGQIARIARCLQDPEPRIAGLAHLFFEELSHKVTKVTADPAPRTTTQQAS